MLLSDLAVTWKDSINLLAWKELRLLILASLNNFRRALHLTITYLWWLWALWLILLMAPLWFNVILTPHQIFDVFIFAKVPWALPTFRLHEVRYLFWSFMGLFFMVDTITYFSYFLSTRASIEAKDFSYYRAYLPKIIWFFTAQLLALFCLAPLNMLPALLGNNIHVISIAQTIISVLTLPIPTLVGYIFLDQDQRSFLQTLKKGFLFFIYFFPLISCFSLLYLLIIFMLYGIATLIITTISSTIVITSIVLSVYFIQSLIVSLWFLSCCATVYLKIKHTHPNLFFAE